MAVIISGNAGVLSWWDGTGYKPLGCLSDFDVAISKNVVTRETLCNPGVIEKRAGNQDTTVNFNGYYANTDNGAGGEDDVASFDDLLSVIQVGTEGDFEIDTGGSKTYYVTGFISELNAGWTAADEDSSFSGVISVSTTVGEVDPNAT